MTISSKDGLVDQVSYFNKTVASKDMSGYYLLKNGEFAYNKSYSVGYDFGSIKRLDRYPKGALSTLLSIPTLGNRGSGEMETGVPAKRKPLPRRKRSESRAAASKSYSLKALSSPYTSRMDL